MCVFVVLFCYFKKAQRKTRRGLELNKKALGALWSNITELKPHWGALGYYDRLQGHPGGLEGHLD